MELSFREFWTSLHGMGFGAVFLLGFSAGFVGLCGLRQELLTPEGIEHRVRRLKIGLWLMAILAWFTVGTGTWIVYIWYRAKAVPGVDLSHFPRQLLMSKKSTEDWHEFGMEWKEHVAWIVPIVATTVAYVVQVYGGKLAAMPSLRRSLVWMLTLAFGAAAVAGGLGAFINKMAPTR